MPPTRNSAPKPSVSVFDCLPPSSPQPVPANVSPEVSISSSSSRKALEAAYIHGVATGQLYDVVLLSYQTLINCGLDLQDSLTVAKGRNPGTSFIHKMLKFS